MRGPVSLAILLLAPLLAGGCAGARPDQAPFAGEGSPESRSRDRDAETLLIDLDRAIDATRTLPPAEALERQRALGPRIDQVAERSAGTRHENKAVYLQAQWRFQFRDDGEGVDAALDRLDALEKPAFKASGRALRVQHLLRQERLAAAHALADRVIAEVPEFGFLAGMVRWHERAGGTVASTAGIGLDGKPVDPAQSPQRWLLYLHLPSWNDQTAFMVRRYLDAIGDRDVQLIPVVRDGGARRIGDAIAALPGATRVTALWCRGAEETKRVLAAWEPPFDGWTVLLDGDRRIARVEVRPGDIAAAVK